MVVNGDEWNLHSRIFGKKLIRSGVSQFINYYCCGVGICVRMTQSCFCGVPSSPVSPISCKALLLSKDKEKLSDPPRKVFSLGWIV